MNLEIVVHKDAVMAAQGRLGAVTDTMASSTNAQLVGRVQRVETEVLQMQTTLKWRGLFMDLYQKKVNLDSHKYVNPYRENLTSDKRGYITQYSSTLSLESHSLVIFNSDDELKEWKCHHTSSTVVSSKKRVPVIPVKDCPVGCHYTKINLLQCDSSTNYDAVYIPYMCLDNIKDLPRGKKYVLTLNKDQPFPDRKSFNFQKFQLFGVSDDIIFAVSNDQTGVLFYFLVASCYQQHHLVRNKHVPTLCNHDYSPG